MNSDYNGFLPDQSPFVDNIPPVIKFPERPANNRTLSEIYDLLDRRPPRSPIQDLTDQMIHKTMEAREKLLRNLVENPGVVATFGDDFIVEFGDLELHTLDSPDDRNLNEYCIEITQKWRIRRRKEDDGDRTSLGRDPGGEAQEG